MNNSSKEYFQKHWKSFETDQITETKLSVAKEFLKPLFKDNPLKRKNILDVGCGNGVHYEVFRNHVEYPYLRFVGVDISSQVVDYLRVKYQDHESFISGDALNLPFDDNYFDIVFSFGVLGYTEDPKNGFSEMVRVCKPGGRIGLWLYPKKYGVAGLIFNIVRVICKHTNDFLNQRIADFIVPFLFILPTRSGLNLSNATWQQCREVVMVNIAPNTLSFFTKHEVIGWFNQYGVVVMYEDIENEITLWGKRNIQ